jgi:cobalt/nickel transport system permease protein
MTEQNQMDSLAYGSRMVSWAPLGKLFLVICIITVNLISTNILVPLASLAIGLGLMFYSTNMRFPKVLVLMILESLLIIFIGSLCICILPSNVPSPIVWETYFWGLHFVISEYSINYAFLIFVSCVAGVSVMLAFSSSTPIPHLAQSLRQLRIPPEIVEMVVLIYRYSFLLLEQMVVMWNAASTRLGFRGLRRSVSTTAKIAVNIFINAMNISARSDAALASRNYTGSFPVFRKPHRMTATWVIVPVILAVCLYGFGLLTAGWLVPSSIIL